MDRPEDVAARRALRELRRLASEATRRFEQRSLIETSSSLTAMATVLEPLFGYVQRTWVEVEVTTAAPEHERPDTVGMYL